MDDLTKDLNYFKKGSVEGSWPGSWKVDNMPNGGTVVVFHYKNNTGTTTFYNLWPGITLCLVNYDIHWIPVPKVKNYGVLQLNYCTAGRCEMNMGEDRSIYLEPGDFSINTKPPREAMISPVGHYGGVQLILDLPLLLENMPSVFSDFDISIEQLKEEFCPENKSYIAKAVSSIAEIYQKILNLPSPFIPKYRLLIVQLLYALCHDEQPKDSQAMTWVTKGQRAIVQSVYHKVTNDFSVRYSIEELTEEFGISASSFKQYFKTVYGQAFSVFMRKIRMEEANRLLQHTNNQVGEIAMAVGYENQSKFAKVFKETTGESPLEYRRKFRGGLID